MEKFDLKRTASGDQLKVPFNGPSLLRFSLYNKGTGFTAEERERFDLIAAAEFDEDDGQDDQRQRRDSDGGLRIEVYRVTVH